MTVLEFKDTSCDVKELSKALNDNVVVLRITNVELTGSDDDMYTFSTKVRGHPSLKEFKMKDVKVADPATSLDQVVSCLLVSTSAETLSLNNTPVTSTTISTVTHCPSLQALILPNNGFTDSDASLIANALTAHKAIKTVDLSGNELSDVGCKAIENLVDKTSSLQVLKLEGNKGISGAEFTKIGTMMQGRAAIAA